MGRAGRRQYVLAISYFSWSPSIIAWLENAASMNSFAAFADLKSGSVNWVQGTIYEPD
jgi:hypothetical protein